MKILIENLLIPLSRVPLSASSAESVLPSEIAAYCKVKNTELKSFTILQKSIDARSRHDIKFLYRIAADIEDSARLSESLKVPFDGAAFERCFYEDFKLSSNLPLNPIVAGSGPAGLMAAFLLAKYGMKPIVLERGFDVDRRHIDIDLLYRERKLNPESNFLYGEGGAGTYSDGKLYTRIRDERIKFILDLFHAAGASEEILYLKHPHIGSDILPGMVKNIRLKIESMGGRFIWGMNVTDILTDNAGTCRGVILADGSKMEAPFTIIAAGLSSRTLMMAMAAKGVENKLKDFQIGSRIEHEQSFINKSRYGMEKLPPFLKSAEYSVTSRPAPERGIGNVTSFCMCPGGEIIPAASEEFQLSSNGMSKFARDGSFANSALIVNQKAENFKSAAEAFEFLINLEKRTFEAGASSYSIPAQDAAAFVKGVKKLSNEESSYKLGLVPERIDEILPESTVKSLREALMHFEKIMPGFMNRGKFVGLETRVSSPLRFLRSEETFESSMKNLYIAGEGAGYAGGIMSAAVDGLKIAEAILKN